MIQLYDNNTLQHRIIQLWYYIRKERVLSHRKAGTRQDWGKIIGLSGTTAVPIWVPWYAYYIGPSASTHHRQGTRGEQAAVPLGLHLLMPSLLSEVLGASRDTLTAAFAPPQRTLPIRSESQSFSLLLNITLQLANKNQTPTFLLSQRYLQHCLPTKVHHSCHTLPEASCIQYIVYFYPLP